MSDGVAARSFLSSLIPNSAGVLQGLRFLNPNQSISSLVNLVWLI